MPSLYFSTNYHVLKMKYKHMKLNFLNACGMMNLTYKSTITINSAATQC